MKKITSFLFILILSVSAVFGQTRSYCDSIQADYSYTVSGTKVSFTVKTTGSIIAQEWSFGDGTAGKDLNAVKDYGKPGTYQPCLTLKLKNLRDPNNPCVKKICKSVTIQDPCSTFKPKASLTLDSNGVATFEADFDSSYSYYWDFGDNTNSSNRTGKHQYKAGSYKACVKIYNTKTKCYAYVCFNITVGGNPCDKFKPGASVKVDSNGVATFEADSGANLTYKWSFGDGTYATTRTGKHQYKAGTYQACVTITDSKTNCTKTLCFTVNVRGSDPCSNFNPKFEYKIDSNGKVYFWGVNSNGTNYKLMYVWSFGDGTSGTGTQVSHTYKPGTYKFCVTIKDSVSKCSKTYCETITIKGGGSVPDSCKYFNPTFGYKLDGTKVVFEAQYGSTYSYEWSFGNFGSSKDRIAKIDFKNPGTYKVCLTVYDSKTGCKKTVCKEIIIKGKNTKDPCKDFNPKVGFQIQGGKVFFTGDGGKGATFEWNFGDGSKGSKDRNPVHTYAKSGKYTVCVIVYDIKRTCKKQICFTIEVTVKSSDPCTKFNPDFGFSINGNKITVEGNKTSNVKYFWDFGDKQSDTGRVTDHTYKVSGKYTVCMTAYDVVNKCKKTVCKTITLKQRLIGQNNGEDAQIMTYPNPVEQNVYVITNSVSAAKIIIKNTNGVELMRYDATPDDANTIQLWVEQLPKGVYYMSVEQDGKVETTKFIK